MLQCDPVPWRTRGTYDYVQDEKNLCKDRVRRMTIILWSLMLGPLTRVIMFSMNKNAGEISNWVSIKSVQNSDAGVYWFAIERPYTDIYSQLIIQMTSPPTGDSSGLITDQDDPNINGSQKKYVASLILSPTIPDHSHSCPRWAFSQCQGNMAYAVTVLQKKTVEYNGDCWVCQTLPHR